MGAGGCGRVRDGLVWYVSEILIAATCNNLSYVVVCAGFGRCRPAPRAKLEDRVGRGRVDVLGDWEEDTLGVVVLIKAVDLVDRD